MSSKLSGITAAVEWTGVELRVLGGFSARVDGTEVPRKDWPSLRAAQLVQLLALAPGHSLLREQVIEALWPRLDPEAGAANLRKAAHHARQALRRPGAVVLQAGRVALCPSIPLVIDAAHFERLADAALAQADMAACSAAADAYGGELLPDSQYEAWTEAVRTRLRSRYLELLRVGEQWERLSEAEPADEPAHRALIERELAAGNRAAALRWYARLRSALQESLGLAPDQATEALYERCIAALRPSMPPFLGRETELAQVRAWLRAAAAERSGGLVVRGPAGIGKTALCAQIASAAREQGWTVLKVDVAQPDRPYAATAAAIEQLVLDNRSLLDKIGSAARAVLAALTAVAAPAPVLQGPLGRHQVIGAFRRLLIAKSGGGPVLVLVDDAHMVEEADADVMLQLVATGRPVFIGVAMRPIAPETTLARGIARLAGHGELTLIHLGPLADEVAGRLVAHAAPAPLAAEVVSRVVRLAGGNPFAALELARGIKSGAAERLPVDVREAITARMVDVDGETLWLLKSLALAGDALDPALAVALGRGREADAFAALDRALAAQILIVADGRYRFRHELVRQALIEQISPHQRLKMHRAAAALLVQTHANPALIAHHWRAGGCEGEATAWSVEAARNAMRVGAFKDALNHLEPVLLHERGHPEALRLRAEALDALGEPGAPAAYDAAAGAAGEALSHDLRAKAALAQVKLGDPRGGLRRLEGLNPTTVEGRLAEALAYSGAAALGVADPAMGTMKAAVARRLALESGDTGAIVIASWAQAAAAHARGELHTSVWADLHDTHQVPHLAVRVFDGHLCITQRFLYGARPYAEVKSFADELAAEAQRLGAVRGHAFGVTLRGEAELLGGELDAAEEHLTLGGRLHRAIGGATGEALALQRRAELALLRGRRDDASALLDEALDLARQTDIGFHLLDRIYGTRIALAESADAALAAVEEAREAVRGPLETCPGCRITFAVPAAIAAARAQRPDLVAEYEPAVKYLANVVMRLPAWYAALSEVEAQIAAARGDARTATSLFATAAQRFQEAGQPLDADRCARQADTG
jgi:DNA-binding SARP family transcriptional activator